MARRLLPVPLVVIGLLLTATPAAAETTAKVDGNVIRITIVVDVVDAKGKTGPNGQPLVDYWETVLNDTWGAAFNQLPYKNCFKLELKVKLNERGSGFDQKTGNHRIIVAAASGGSFQGTGFDGTPETTRNPKTGDGTRSFDHDRDGAIPADAPPTVVAHEFGHLMGLGDDRANGAPKTGRDGTMMVGGVPGVDPNVVQKIDKNLVNRIGEAITKHLENQGKKLPKCEEWKGTMNHTVTQVGASAGHNPCGDPQELQGTARFVVGPNGEVTASYDVEGCGVSEPHAEFTGTATDEGFSFPQLIVQTNGELIPKVSPTRARATLTNLQGSAAGGAQWVTKWDMRCVNNCGEAAAVG